jgi:glucokinase-like ROK family protein
LGIDVDCYQAKIAVFNNNNESITGIYTFPLPLDNNPETADRIFEYGSEVIEKSGIDPSKLIGIGISSPGLIDSRTGINYTYLFFGKKSICEILRTKFNRPVFIENDAKAAALAEYRFGLAKGKKDVLVILLDWGIGLGLLLDGKLYRGTSGFAGEFSHIPMVEDGLLCRCGKNGCLETIASGYSMVQLAKEGINSGKSTMLNSLAENEQDKIDAKMIVDAAQNGDQFSINILSEVGFNLGKAIAILIQLYNPELIVLGGRIAEARQYITIPVQQSLNIYCMRQLCEHTSIVVSEMGQHLGIMGAVAVAMERVFDNYKKQKT